MILDDLSRRARRPVRCLLALLVTLAWGAGIAAPAPGQPLARFDRFYEARWLARDGAPGAIGAITQTRDGYLWLTSDRGLMRFDGVEFRPFASLTREGQVLASSTIASLTSDADGALWIGYGYGGLARWKDGDLTNYGQAQGLPVSTTFGVAHVRDGGVWVATANGAFNLSHGRFVRAGAESGLSDKGAARSLVEDVDGNLWESYGEVRVRPRGAERFVPVALPIAVPAAPERWTEIFLDPAGHAWAQVDFGDHHMIGPLPVPGRDAAEVAAGWVRTPRIVGLKLRGDGVAWIASDDGLYLLDPARPPVAGSTLQRALEHSPPNTVFCDREGTTWVGTDDGLFSYRPTKLVPADLPKDAHRAIVSGDEPGTVLVTTPAGTLAGYDGEHLAALPSPGSASEPLQALHRARDGTLWVASAWGVWRRRGDAFEAFGVPEIMKRRRADGPDPYVQTLATDDAGDPWVAFGGSAVFHWRAGRWLVDGGRPDIPHLQASRMAADGAGRLWILMPGDGVLRLDRADAPRVVRVPDLHVGTYTAIAFAEGRTWIAGDDGLALVDASGTHAIVPQGQGTLSGVSGLVQVADGDLWLNDAAGVAHIARAEIERRLRDPSHPLVVQRYDYLDGVASPLNGMYPPSDVVDDRTGRLWLTRSGAVLRLVPDHLYSNPVPPPVRIESLLVDGRAFAAAPTVVLPPGTHDLRIAFTALSLALPQRVRFRYRLEGQDGGWSPALARRDATYTNLAPGDYTFRVTASNEDGAWSETGASLALRVQPAFWQTTAFRVLGALVLAALLWSLHALRLRVAARRAQERQRARTAERERIARELHDTLLQSNEGLLLQVHAAIQDLAPQEPARRRIEASLETASTIAQEARDRVQDLRTTPAPDTELAESLRDAPDVLPRDVAAEVDVTRLGAVRPLMPGVQDEAFRIAREALRNAFAHAQAHRVRVEVRYDADALRVSVADDGVGIDPDVLAAGARAAHWGLRGMRERAEGFGGSLQVSSTPGVGTSVDLVVPAAQAYEGYEGRAHWLRRRRAPAPSQAPLT